MPFSSRFDLALALLDQGCRAAAYRLLCDATPQTLDDVVFLVDLASDLATPGGYLADALERFGRLVERGDTKSAGHAILDALWFAREENAVLTEGLIHAAAIYFSPDLEAIRPPLDWDAAYPETRAAVVAAIKAARAAEPPRPFRLRNLQSLHERGIAMTGAQLRAFREKHRMSPDDLARFLGMRARDAKRSIYAYEAGSTRVPDAVAQIVRLAERLPAARLMLAGELSREAALASV